LGFLLVRIAESLDRDFVAALRDLDLKPRHLRLLVLVDRAGELKQSDLAQQLDVDPGNLVGILETLEGSGLLRRPRGGEDRRRRLVSLTPAGDRRLAEALTTTAAIDERLVEAMPSPRRKDFYEMAQSVYRTL
jgi:DNA-binding MarR family transcriptional regulator